jgi:hypothetical protein
LVSIGSVSASALNSGADIGTGEEKVKVVLAEVLRRLDAIDKLLRSS